MALVLMDAGTEAEAQPVENFVTLETETGIHVIFWGTAPAPNGMERPIRTFAPVQNIPQALLDRVPEHVRTALTTGVTQSSDDWDCHAEAGYPYKSGSKVKARGSVSCVGAPVEETLLDIELSRDTATMDTYSSGWVTWKSHSQTVSGGCAAGTHRYYNGTIGMAELDTDEIWYRLETSSRGAGCMLYHAARAQEGGEDAQLENVDKTIADSPSRSRES